jgi:hypothetical protein
MTVSSLEVVRTWPAEDAYQLRRASAIITNRDDVAQRALLVFSHSLEDVNQIVSSAATREHDDAFGFDATVAVAVGHLCRRHGCIAARRKQRVGGRHNKENASVEARAN